MRCDEAVRQPVRGSEQLSGRTAHLNLVAYLQLSPTSPANE